MDKRKIIIIVIIGIAVLGTVAFGLIKRTPLSPGSVSQTEDPGMEGSGGPTRAPATNGVVVPNKDAANIPENVARPDIQGAGNPSGSTEFRGFSITAQNDAFSPDTIIVTQGDTVRVKFQALGKDYDVTQPDYGFSVSVPRGTEKTFQFDATAAGTFTFFCKTCGGPAKGPVGSLVVVPKK